MVLGKLFESLIKTDVKKKIVRLVLSSEDGLTISEIQKKIKPPYNYRTIWQHIQSLEGIIFKTEKEEHKSGKPVRVSILNEELKAALLEALNQEQDFKLKGVKTYPVFEDKINSEISKNENQNPRTSQN